MSVGARSLRTFVPPAVPWEEETPPTRSQFLLEHVSAKGDLALRSLSFTTSPVTSSRPLHLLGSPATAKILS